MDDEDCFARLNEGGTFDLGLDMAALDSVDAGVSNSETLLYLGAALSENVAVDSTVSFVDAYERRTTVESNFLDDETQRLAEFVPVDSPTGFSPEAETPRLDRGASSIFGWVPGLKTRETVDLFLRSMGRSETVVWPRWPKSIPAEQLFFGELDLGVVDFGGIKAGTPYDWEGTPYGLLVNSSGQNSAKLAALYPSHSPLKVLRIRLYKRIPPAVDERQHWKRQELNCNQSVFLYSRMALYSFGGTVYSIDDRGNMFPDDSHELRQPKAIIFLGPSNKKRTPQKANTFEGPRKKKMLSGCSCILDP